MKSSLLAFWSLIQLIVLTPFREMSEKPCQLSGIQYMQLGLLFLVSMVFPCQIVHAAPPAWLTESFSSTNFEIFYAIECPATEPECTNSELIPITEDTDGDWIPDSFADSNPANGEPDWIEHVATFLEELLDSYDRAPYSLRFPNFSTNPD